MNTIYTKKSISEVQMNLIEIQKKLKHSLIVKQWFLEHELQAPSILENEITELQIKNNLNRKNFQILYSESFKENLVITQ